jgi:hypothetical protein
MRGDDLDGDGDDDDDGGASSCRFQPTTVITHPLTRGDRRNHRIDAAPVW